MATDVTNPELLPMFVELAESVPIDAEREVGICLDSSGALAGDGAYCAGIVYMTTDDPTIYDEYDLYGSIVTNGIAVGKLLQGEVVALDDPLTPSATNGELRVGVVGTDEIIGTARDISTGSGVGVNHYVRLKIERR